MRFTLHCISIKRDSSQNKVLSILYIVISNKYGNRTCILSMLARQMDVVYAYVNKGLLLNIVPMRKMCSSKFSLKNFVRIIAFLLHSGLHLVIFLVFV